MTFPQKNTMYAVSSIEINGYFSELMDFFFLLCSFTDDKK